MTITECHSYVSDILSEVEGMQELDFTDPHTDVFTQDNATKVVFCGKGFDERYAHRAHDEDIKGRYPTRTDVNNIFAVGINHSKLRAVGWRPRWDAITAEAIGGYAKGSIVRDSMGRKFVSRKENNKEQIPTDGTSSSAWVSINAKPTFLGNNILHHGVEYRTSVGFIKLETTLPQNLTTTKLRIASFSGSQIYADFNGHMFDCSGMVVFSTLICWPSNTSSVADRYRGSIYGIPKVLPGGGDYELGTGIDSSFSMKLSPYHDLLTNPEHAENYIELASNRVVWNTSSYPPQRFLLPSPVKAIPIQRDKMYYIYVEYNNERGTSVDSTSSSDVYLEVYPFTRGIEMPNLA